MAMVCTRCNHNRHWSRENGAAMLMHDVDDSFFCDDGVSPLASSNPYKKEPEIEETSPA